MPKQKTSKSLKKRVKVTARGKLMKHMPGSGHLKSRKNAKQLRKMRKATVVPEMFTWEARIQLGV